VCAIHLAIPSGRRFGERIISSASNETHRGDVLSQSPEPRKRLSVVHRKGRCTLASLQSTSYFLDERFAFDFEAYCIKLLQAWIVGLLPNAELSRLLYS